ncbi:MAG: glucosamine-6-phosphate deaminase [Firmicutes bacterium]|nr:glucosamine-6-phosphate deaminase [Bacillota bacterium]
MEIFKYKNYEEVSKASAAIVIREMMMNPELILGLATGTSPIGLYKNLIEAYNNHLISFKNVKTFNLDEYVGIDKFHPQSYYSFMYENLFKHVDINEKNINIPSNDMNNIEQLAAEYNTKMFGNQRDLQILGIGQNGHIGFNEPGSQLSNQTFVVKLDEQTRIDNSRFFSSLEEVPTHAITMGIRNIMYSKKILLIASGKSKADAVYKMVYGPITETLPASILQLHPNITIIIDEDAASMLHMESNHLKF